MVHRTGTLLLFTSAAGSYGYLACGWVVLLSATFAILVIFTRNTDDGGNAFVDGEAKQRRAHVHR